MVVFTNTLTLEKNFSKNNNKNIGNYGVKKE